jgi:hypothetical protein
MASKCSYRDCEKQREKGRMFCSDHVDGHGVSDVVSFRGSRNDSSGGGNPRDFPPKVDDPDKDKK